MRRAAPSGCVNPALSETLAGVFAVLPEALASKTARQKLEPLMQSLPPFYSGGFECRLGRGDGPVDLQLCLRRDDSLTELLTAPLREALRLMLPDKPVWRALDTLLANWRQRDLEELWIEFDERKDGWRPSVFLGLPQEAEGRALHRVVAQLDFLLGVESRQGLRANVERCHAACPDGVFISHVGLMLGRKGTGLRLNVKRLRPDTLPRYLEAVGWPGEHDDVLPLAKALFDASDRITLTLDVGECLTPDLGLECVAGPKRQAWQRLLDLLVARGLCRPEARDGVLDWPLSLKPTALDPPWPADLMRAALLAPPQTFVGIDLHLSHVKVAFRPGGVTEAKGYLWFAHSAPPANLQTDPALALYHAWSPPGPLLERVRTCFAYLTDIYLSYLGTTFQAWLFEADGDVAASNIRLAQRAGVKDGMRVLDAGCGVGGPAMDIAGAFDVTIEGITICPRQVAVGTRLVEAARLGSRISIREGDYHHLPWPDDWFDVVLFLESSNHTEDPVSLFREVNRVLRPGGQLYIIDTCTPPVELLDSAARRAVELFDHLFADNTRSLPATHAALEAAGFSAIETADLTGQVSARRWDEASWRIREGERSLTPFGAAHHVVYPTPDGLPPIFCGEVRAVKPKGEGIT